MLLVVPGIIKHYEYSLIPYILAENPTMQYKRAGTAQYKNVRRAEDGDAEKDLSFLFWEIAGIFSLGLVSVFYTMPYREFAKGRAL